MEQQIEIRPEPQVGQITADSIPTESHEAGCACGHDSDDEVLSYQHDGGNETGGSDPEVESCSQAENESGPVSMAPNGLVEGEHNSSLHFQEEQCLQEQNQQMKEEPMQDIGQDPAPAAEAQPQQQAAPRAQPQQQASPQAQPQQQAAPQAQPQQQASPQAQQATVDPAAYAAWQQAMWQQQMAAAQAGHPGYPYIDSHAAIDPGLAQDSGTNSHHLKNDAHKYGQIVQMAEKFVNGDADISDVVNGISMLENQDSQFWRGLLVGGVATLILNSDQVKNGMAKLFQRNNTDE